MYSPITGTGNGSAPVVSITWPFIDTSHVKAQVDGVPVTITWTGASQVTFAAAVANGSSWVVYRDTPISDPLVDFTDGAVLTADDLDLDNKQLRFHQEETVVNIPQGLTGPTSVLRDQLASPEGLGYPIQYVKAGNLLTAESGGEEFSLTEGASGDVYYWGREYSGQKAPGANVLTNLGYGPTGWMFDLRTDTADAEGDFVRVLFGRTIFGGAGVFGGRIGLLGEVYQQLGATSPTNTNRNYVGVVGQSQTDTGDGGTAGSELGHYFGGNFLARLDAGAVHVEEATGAEFNTYVKTGASVSYLFGNTIVGFNEVRGSELDAALEIGGGTDSGFGPHVGWKFGFVFSDVHGGDPLASDSTVLGTHWITGGPRAVTNGIDLSGFTISGDAFKSTGFAINGAGVPTFTLGNYADDVAAAAGGVAIGQLYHNAGAVRVRLT